MSVAIYTGLQETCQSQSTLVYRRRVSRNLHWSTEDVSVAIYTGLHETCQSQSTLVYRRRVSRNLHWSTGDLPVAIYTGLQETCQSQSTLVYRRRVSRNLHWSTGDVSVAIYTGLQETCQSQSTLVSMSIHCSNGHSIQLVAISNKQLSVHGAEISADVRVRARGCARVIQFSKSGGCVCMCVRSPVI